MLSLSPDEAVEELRGRLTARPTGQAPCGLQLYGKPSSGRTTVLDRLEERLQGERLPTLRIVPSGDWDSGIGIILQLAAFLGAQGDARAFEAVCDQSKSWEEKLSVVSEAARALPDGRCPIVLVDPVDLPSADETQDDLPAAQYVEEAVRFVRDDLPWRRVMATAKLRRSRHAQTWKLVPERPGASFLRRAEWGALTATAEQLAADGLQHLFDLEAFQLRLIVGVAEIESVPFALRKVQERYSAPMLLDLRVGDDPQYSDLRAVWARLSLVRTAFDREVLQIAGADALGERERDLLVRCLLCRRKGRYALHPLLRRERSRPWLAPHDLRLTHERLRDYHRERRDRLLGAARIPPLEAIIHHAEAFHHAQAAGDIDGAQALQLGFIEEMDALGRSLSLRWRRYADAAAVFQKVLIVDPGHAYAHHYLAYNLDIEGKRAREVERHYQKAIEEQPEHPWWHSRWIRFLLTRGRTRDARQAFSEASALIAAPDTRREQLYKQLHLEVARMALHRMELDLAREVLDQVPASLRDELPGYGPLSRRLRVLLEVEQHGAVFPAWLSPDEWWKGAHLFRQEEPSLGQLLGWSPARVDSIDLDARIIWFRTAQPPAGENETPTYGWMDVSFDDFDRLRDQECPRARELTEDTFVEFAWFARGGRADAEQTRVRAFTPEEPEALPKIFPDPDRYLARWNVVGSEDSV